jgi:protein-L-isoaspartate(D-aspartate) O-methyltransferase
MNKQELLNDLKENGFNNNIISAFEKIKRQDFVPVEFKSSSYENIPLPIGYSQTISQPYTIAFMLNLLKLSENQSILEIGSGSGYVLALLSKIIKNGKIYGIERIKALAEKSKNILKNYRNIKIINKDGSMGLEKFAPYDRILISASLKDIPLNLMNQLKNNGILVAPVRNSIYYIKKRERENEIKEFPGFVFVPLLDGVE